MEDTGSNGAAAAPITPIMSLRYDLRSAPFGRPHADQYAAMLEQVRWADQMGFMAATFSEHHASDDGYLPSPLVTAAAVTGATENIRVMISALLLPLYDLVRLAEDMAVLDLVSGGRVDLVIGAGYRPEEFELHGRSFKGRFRVLEDGVAFLRSAWTGEPFEHDGRTVQILPKPYRPGGPMLFIGGSSDAAARRAARIGDGFMAVSSDYVPAYLAECEKLGREPGLATGGGSGPLFVHVSEDPERAWDAIAPYALHETNSYGRWLADSGNLGPYTEMQDADALRAGGGYAVFTPQECVEFVRGQGGVLTLHPLMGGLDPDLAAESLALIESKVVPALKGT